MYYNRHWLNKWRKRKKERQTLLNSCVEMVVDLILQNHIQITPIVWRSRRSDKNPHAWKTLKVKASGEWHEQRERMKSIEITQLFVIAFKSEINFRHFLFIIFLFQYFSLAFDNFLIHRSYFDSHFQLFFSSFLLLNPLYEALTIRVYITISFFLSCPLVPHFYWKMFWTVKNNRMKTHCFVFVISSPMRFLSKCMLYVLCLNAYFFSD